MGKLPPRDENIDQTRSTLQRTINSLRKKLSDSYEALARKRKKMGEYNRLVNILICKEKTTRKEVKEILNSKNNNYEELVINS